MKKLIVIILVMMVCFGVVSYFFITNVTRSPVDRIDPLLSRGNLILQMPDAIAAPPQINRDKNITKNEIFIDELFSFEFILIEENHKLFLQLSPDFNDMQLTLDHRRLTINSEGRPSKKWSISFTKNDNVQIEGFCYSEYGSIKVELTGHKQESGVCSGTGFVSFISPEKVDDSEQDPYKHIFKINWRLFPKDVPQDEDKKIKTITLTRPFPAPKMPAPPPLSEEEDLRIALERMAFEEKLLKHEPPIQQSDFRYAKQYPEATRVLKCFGDARGVRVKILHARDQILTDINWDELIPDNTDQYYSYHLPSSLILLPHLATIDNQEIKDEIAQRYGGRIDKSHTYVIDRDLKTLNKIPLLFLLVY
jgi:hypothetical protein